MQTEQVQIMDAFIVFHSGKKRTWGNDFFHTGSVLHLFGKIIVRPNEETIDQMITKIKEKYKNTIHVTQSNDIIFVRRTNSLEEITFVPSNKNPNMAMTVGSQNKKTMHRFAYWRSVEYLALLEAAEEYQN